MRRSLVPLLLTGLFVLGGCTTGEGQGEITSDRLYVEDCWNGPFDLGPTFFGANPYDSEQLAMRIQRGDNNQEASDGLSVVITELQSIRNDQLNVPVRVALPVGVSPLGVPDATMADPASVSMSLYLHDTCHAQNGALYAIRGTITFRHLFSGDASESSGEDRLTDAEFDAEFADPRDSGTDGEIDPSLVSRVTGWFRFYFQRGQPAQPFP
jgi:hypothetical protein